MKKLPQPDPITCLSAFPKLKFIGGSVGHRLDIHAGCAKSNLVKISIPGRATLALEQVIIYGKRSSTEKILDVSKLPGVKTAQSSTRCNPNQSEEEALKTYGSQKAVNGIVDGYDRSETKNEVSPSWVIIFPEEIQLETIHITNFSASNYADKNSDIVIEYKKNNDWHQIYRRSAPHILSAKFNKTLNNLRKILEINATSSHQLFLQDYIKNSLETLQSDPLSTPADLSEMLLDCAEAFLPISLEPGGRSYQFRDIANLAKIRISGIHESHSMPLIEIKYLSSSTGEWHVKKENTCLMDLGEANYVSELNVSFAPSEHIFTANSFRIDVSDLPRSIDHPDTSWTLLYDNSKVATICKDIAWAAYLAGNETARCVALIAKPAIMMRRSHSEQTEAYYWCRLNLHGKTPDFKREVTEIVNTANKYDTKTSRLKFGRHSFSTCLADRNQNSYLDAISSTIRTLNENSLDTMLLYGTLLGAVRDGTFISHDDDVDIGYISTAESHSQLISERTSIIEFFKSKNFIVSSATSHLTFSVSHRENPQPYWVEIFPIWQDSKHPENVKMYMSMMNIHSVPAHLIGSVENRAKVALNGVDFPAPADPEGFLELRYGPTWKTPDPFFEI